MATLYVGNLKWECTDDELRELFAGYNPTDANVVFGRNGRSRGYGLVSFGDAADAASATANLNEQEFQGRRLVVREDRGATKSSAGNNGPEPNFTGTSVFVSNLAWAVTDEILNDEFATYQPVSATVATRKDGRSRGWGTVKFNTPEDAQRAIDEMNNIEIEGRNIETRIDRRA